MRSKNFSLSGDIRVSTAVDLKIADAKRIAGVLKENPGPSAVELQQHLVVVVRDVSSMGGIPVQFAERFRSRVLHCHGAVETDECGEKTECDVVL